jgi:hypothetical protein
MLLLLMCKDFLTHDFLLLVQLSHLMRWMPSFTSQSGKWKNITYRRHNSTFKYKIYIVTVLNSTLYSTYKGKIFNFGQYVQGDIRHTYLFI